MTATAAPSATTRRTILTHSGHIGADSIPPGLEPARMGDAVDSVAASCTSVLSVRVVGEAWFLAVTSGGCRERVEPNQLLGFHAPSQRLVHSDTEIGASVV